MQRRTLLQASLGALLLPRAWSAARPLRMAVFPDYNIAAVLEQFQHDTGIAVQTLPFDSNEDLLAACLRGEQFDVLTLSHYMVPHFTALGLLRPLSPLLLSDLGPSHWQYRFARFGQIDQQWLAVPKNYGTTGFLYRTDRLPELHSWREFWDAISGPASRRCSLLDDVQTLIGAALRYHGHSINSTRPGHLLQAEQLLQQRRPHVRALVADIDAAVAAGDELLMSWSDSGYWLNAEDERLRFVNPIDGGEVWCDFYAIGRSSPLALDAEQLLGWLLQPAQIVQEVIELGVSPVDNRVLAMLPVKLRENPIVFPPREVLARAEMSNQEALREPLRNEIFARFVASF